MSGTKAYERKVAARRTMQELKRFIDGAERMKTAYIEKAKQARTKNAYSSYELARSGLKTVMMQLAKAEEMLLNLELLTQYADFAKLSGGFVRGMDSVSKELTKAVAKTDFSKAEKLFHSALKKADIANDKMTALLGSTSDGFSVAASLSDIVDSEIDKLVGNEIISAESEIDRKLLELKKEESVQRTVDAQREVVYEYAPQKKAYVPSQKQEQPAAKKPFRTDVPAVASTGKKAAEARLSGDALRPQRLEDFHGQPAVEKKLREQIFYAKQKGEPLPHVFIYGQKGLGKTTIAQIIANEMGGRLHDVHSGTISSVDKVIALLKSIKPNDVLLVDEIHCLSKSIQDAFLKPVEDFEFTPMEGKGKYAKCAPFKIPKFTMIGATTDNGDVRGTLFDRLRKVDLRLEPYPPEFLAEIITGTLKKLDGVGISFSDALDLAKRSRGTPRIAINYCRNLCAKAAYQGKRTIDGSLLAEFYADAGLDEKGLLKQDRELLTALIVKFGGGPVGIETLANAIGDKKGNVTAEIEPYLNRLGLISVVAGGRVAMDAAYLHLGLEKAQTSGKAQPTEQEQPQENQYKEQPQERQPQEQLYGQLEERQEQPFEEKQKWQKERQQEEPVYEGDEEDEEEAQEESKPAVGNPAERAAAEALSELGEKYTVYNDILLRSRDGRTFQIDHLVVSPYGVFAIETKNYSGKIEGYRNAEFLRQTKRGMVKCIYNPIIQNAGHIRALFETVGNYPYFSLAAFSDYAELDIKDGKDICNVSGLCGRIGEHTDVLLADGDIAKINESLKEAMLIGEGFREQHVAAVKAARERKRKK